MGNLGGLGSLGSLDSYFIADVLALPVRFFWVAPSNHATRRTFLHSRSQEDHGHVIYLLAHKHPTFLSPDTFELGGMSRFKLSELSLEFIYGVGAFNNEA